MRGGGKVFRNFEVQERSLTERSTKSSNNNLRGMTGRLCARRAEIVVRRKTAEPNSENDEKNLSTGRQ